MEMHQSGRVNPAAPFARLLRKAKPMFGPLATVRIAPPSASADRQPGESGSSLPGVNPHRDRRGLKSPAESNGNRLSSKPISVDFYLKSPRDSFPGGAFPTAQVFQ